MKSVKISNWPVDILTARPTHTLPASPPSSHIHPPTNTLANWLIRCTHSLASFLSYTYSYAHAVTQSYTTPISHPLSLVSTSSSPLLSSPPHSLTAPLLTSCEKDLIISMTLCSPSPGTSGPVKCVHECVCEREREIEREWEREKKRKVWVIVPIRG